MTYPYDTIEVELTSTWGDDKAVAHTAWASSFDAESLEKRSNEDIRRVVRGIVEQNHETPKERFWMEFFITCPIFVERQFDKYRMTVQTQWGPLEVWHAPMGRDYITQNELSGRYRTIPERPYLLPPDVENVMVKALGHDNAAIFCDSWDGLLQQQHDDYAKALERLRQAEKAGSITNVEYKRAREVLRGILGTSYMTDMRILMNGGAFEHIINQRLDAHAQLESRLVAAKMLRQVLMYGKCWEMFKKMVQVNDWEPWYNEIRGFMKWQPLLDEFPALR